MCNAMRAKYSLIIVQFLIVAALSLSINLSSVCHKVAQLLRTKYSTHCKRNSYYEPNGAMNLNQMAFFLR